MSTNLDKLNRVRVLVLNSTYEPLKFQGWIVTVHNLYEEVALPVEITHDGEIIVARSAYSELVIPSVIRLKKYAAIQHKSQAPYSPQNVYIRDNWQCQLQIKNVCNAPEIGDLKFQQHTIDHVIPQYYGGKSNYGNCVAACYTCNQYKKHHMSIKPVKQPRTPTWMSIYHKKYIRTSSGPQEWNNYLGNK